MSRRSIGRYLIGAAFIALLAKVYNDRSEKRRTKATQEKTGNAEKKALLIKPQAANEGWHAEERTHHRKERVFWRWTLILYGLTFAATAAAACFAYGAYCQTRRQADIAQADQRPWVKVEVALRGGTEFFGGGGIVDVSYKVENVGHSPAIDVRINTWAYVGRSYDAGLFDFVRVQCKAFSRKTSMNQEQKWIVFPHDTILWDGSLGNSVPGYSAEDMKKIVVKDDGRKSIPITFAGCADYIDGSDKRHHQTAFVYDVYQLVMSQGVKAKTPYVDTTVPLAADQLLLQRLPAPADMTN